MSKFFEQCQLESSQFDLEFAKHNYPWLYLNRKYNEQSIEGDEIIPKVFHFIWLGSKLPKWYESNIDDWKQKNPKFSIKVWNDEEAEKILSAKNLPIFKSAASFGIKSDILRYEILYQEGGLYLDTDFLCLSSDFASLHHSYGFYTSVMLDREPTLTNGFIAAQPGHPILRSCVENIDISKFLEIQCPQTRVLYQTGPFYLTKIFWSYVSALVFLHREPDFFIMPTKSIFPFPAIYRNETTEELLKKYIQPESIACHLWHSSWQPNSKFYQGNLL